MKKGHLQQLIMLTKYSLYGFLLQCFFLSTLFANDGNAQTPNIKEVFVDLNVKAERIDKVLDAIEKQTEFSFVYNSKILDNSRKVTITAKKSSLSNVLIELSKQAKIKFKQVNQNISIQKLDEKEDGLGYIKASLAPVSVTGRVTDEATGEGVPGVTVLVKGTDIGTITDINGEYNINVPDDGDVLMFSFIGYATQEVPINGRSTINVSFAEDVQALEEVVVVGYGEQKKANLTGSVGTVEMEGLATRPLTNASVALQGQVAGVYANQTSGKPGDDAATINIRGVGTLNNSNPLVLIDGFPGNMNDVNPQDIESISVLKDAASAAIYGSRAANGVVLITTKRGKGQKMKVTYNGYYGVQQPTALPETFNSVQYATLHNEASINSGRNPMFTDEDIRKYREGTDPLYPDIDYFDTYYDNATIQNHHFNISGGSENLNYAFMAGYLGQDGILVGTDFERFTFRSNFDAYFLNNDRLKLSAKLFGTRGDRNSPTDEWGAKWYATNAPIHPLKNADGEWAAVIGERNVYAEIAEGSITNDLRHQFNGQFGFDFEILSGFNFETTYGYSLAQNVANSFNANHTLDKLDGSYKTVPAALTERNSQDQQTLLTSLLRFQKVIGRHEISTLAGYQEETFRTDWSNAFRRGFINNHQREIRLGDASTMTNDGGAYDLGLQSYFGRVGYTFNDRYLFEANLRRDGSSRFAEGLKWGTFPSVSAGWIISEESFMQTLGKVDMLKVRASWGQLGNQNINSNYAASEILSTGQNYSLGGVLMPGVASTSLANPNTSWETTTQTNIGIDLAVLQNLSFTIDYFQKETNDILMRVPIPITMGDLEAPYQNVGRVSNKGFEFSGSYHKRFNNKLNFNTTFNFSHISNQVLDLHGRSPIINGQTALVEGYAINSYYGYKLDGIYQVSDFAWQNDSDPSIPHTDRNYQLRDDVVAVANYQAQPGDLKFKDLDGDGIVTMEEDRTVLGKQFPDWTYSLQMNADWKGFDLGIFLQGVEGINGYTYYEIATPYTGFANNGIWWLDRWTIDNQGGDLPRLTHEDTRKNIHSEFYMEDASYLRIKNIELGYTLPARLLSAWGMGNVRFYGNVQNAFTFTSYKGFDPEQPVGENRAHAYPQVRIITFGVNVGL